MLAFPLRERHLCLAQKDKIMCAVEKKFERFAQWLLDGGARAGNELSYEAVCLHLRVSPASLDAYARKELGMEGPEILYWFQFLLDL